MSRPHLRGGLWLAVLAALATAVPACAPQAPTGSPSALAARATFPGQSWDSIADPGSAGWSAAGLDSVRDSLATLPSTGFVAIVGGRILMRYGNIDTVTYLAGAIGQHIVVIPALDLVAAHKTARDSGQSLLRACRRRMSREAQQDHYSEATVDLGNFSVSLAVKDIEASKRFYEKLGFSVFMGNQSQNWLILKNGEHIIGLFQGMFEKNIFTFNPGWNADAQPLGKFTDVRDLQRELKASGVTMMTEADEGSTGPASFMIADPDGNTILVDQHV